MNKFAFLILNVSFWMLAYFIGTFFLWEIPPFSTTDDTFFWPMIVGNIFNAIIFYGHGFVIYPKRAESKKINYWQLTIGFITVISLLEIIIDYCFGMHQGSLPNPLELFSKSSLNNILLFLFHFSNRVFGIHILYYLLSFPYILPIQNKKQKERAEILEKENLNAELKYLKAQINPHFMFNGINNVYHLIDYNPEKAKSTLLYFSDILRHQLYETSDNLIALEKQIKFISDYIEMEKIRKGDDISVTYSKPKKIPSFLIAPMLFIPFIENAFKYVSNHSDGMKNKIKIDITIVGSKLKFFITNSLDSKSINKKIGGIGMENVIKRLELLYPNKHLISVDSINDIYSVFLEIDISNK